MDWRDSPITLSFALGKMRNASNDKMTIARFVDRHLTSHKIRSNKDSDGFSCELADDTPAGVKGKNLTSANAKAWPLLAFDFDDGKQSYEEVTQPLRDAGIAFIGYSSYSHMRIKGDAPSVPKFRVMVFLTEPCILFAEDGEDRAIRHDSYKRAYGAFVAKFGWSVDPSCANAARLFYLPAHDGSADSARHVFVDHSAYHAGTPFDFAPFLSVARASIVAEREAAAAKKAEREVKKKAKKEKHATFETPGLDRFRQHCGAHFDVKAFIRDICDDAIETATGAVNAVCPNEDHHTGGADGRATMFAFNAGDPDGKGGIHESPLVGCNHTTCTEVLSTWEFIDKIGQHYGVGIETLLEYVPDDVRVAFERNADLPRGFRRRGGMIEADTDAKGWTPICADFEVGARVRDETSNGWGTEIAFVNADGAKVTAVVRARDLQKDVGEICANLADAGLQIEARSGLRSCFIDLLNKLSPSETVTLYSRPGWHDRAFVTLMGEVIGGNGRLDPGRTAPVRDPGGDRDTFNALLEQLSDARLYHWQLGVIVGCAGPFLGPLGLDSLQLYIGGASGRGKTTAQTLQAAVWGSPEKGKGLLFPCKATANGLEGLLARGHGQTTALDELRQMEERARRDLIFNLATGQSKTRMNRELEVRKSWTWHQVITISGEQSPAQLFGGEKGRIAGEVVRMPSIDVGVIAPLDDPRFAEQIGLTAKGNFGWLGPDVVRLILKTKWHDDPSTLRKLYDAKHTALLNGSIHAADYRATALFALLWTVGELLQTEGLLPMSWNIEAAVKWAYGTFADSDDIGNMDPMSSARDALMVHIRANPAKFPVVGSADATRSGHSGFDGWTLPHEKDADMITVCIRSDAFERIVGNITTGGAFKSWLANEGVLLKQGNNLAWQYVPGVGSGVRHYRLKVEYEPDSGVADLTALDRLTETTLRH